MNNSINFVTSHFIPENTACTNRVVAIVRELEKLYNVNIICLSEKGVIPPEHEVNYSARTKIFYIKQDDYDGKNFVKRAFNEVFYAQKLKKKSKEIGDRLLLVTSPYMFLIPIFAVRSTDFKIS